MDTISRVIATLDQIVHRRMLLLVVFSYALAATWPAAGLWIKDARIVDLAAGSARLQASVPAVLLAFLLFGAGVRVRGDRVRVMARRPALVLAGLIANLSVPVAYLLVLMPVLGRWHNPDEVATIVIGLALVASMPVAGSSTGWAQHAGGDMALSLGLVLASTLLSPLTTPLVLQLLGQASPAAASADLHSMASGGTGTFLMAWVLIPSLLGIALRGLLPERWIGFTETLVKPWPRRSCSCSATPTPRPASRKRCDTPTGTSWEP